MPTHALMRHNYGTLSLAPVTTGTKCAIIDCTILYNSADTCLLGDVNAQYTNSSMH